MLAAEMGMWRSSRTGDNRSGLSSFRAYFIAVECPTAYRLALLSLYAPKLLRKHFAWTAQKF